MTNYHPSQENIVNVCVGVSGKVFSYQTGSCSEHPELPGCVWPRPAWCQRWRPAEWNAPMSRDTSRQTYRDRYPRSPPDPGRIPVREGSLSVIRIYRFLCCSRYVLYTNCIILTQLNSHSIFTSQEARALLVYWPYSGFKVQSSVQTKVIMCVYLIAYYSTELIMIKQCLLSLFYRV